MGSPSRQRRRGAAVSLLATALVGAGLARAACQCGYTALSGASLNQPVLFTDLLETDFLHLVQLKDTPDWRAQTHNRTIARARGKYGEAYRLENVIPNPIADKAAFTGSGVNGGDPGLQMRVKPEVVDQMVPVSEIATKRDDLFYGTYRVSMKLQSQKGTCAAFYWVCCFLSLSKLIPSRINPLLPLRPPSSLSGR